MITAKNYAAQAANFIDTFWRERANSWPERYKNEDIGKIDGIVACISSAVHFAIPDGGEIFNDNLKGITGTTIRLPYPIVTVEYFVKKEDAPPAKGFNCEHAPKRLVLAIEISGEDASKLNESSRKHSDTWIAVLGVATREDAPDIWTPDLGIAYIPCEWWDGYGIDGHLDETVGKTGVFAKFAPTFKTLFNNIEDGSRAAELIKADSTSNVRAVAEFCEALSCKNITTDNHQDASPKNAKRIKDGKLPIYETKMLVVDTKANVSINGEYQGGTHSSPRQHLRRGHIRRHPSAGNIWVQSCVVGDPTKGTINKQYSII